MEDFGKEEKNRPVNGPFTVFYVCNLIKITITSPPNSHTSGPKVFLVDKEGKNGAFYGGMCGTRPGALSFTWYMQMKWKK